MSSQKDLSVILDEWEALANAATKEPWFTDPTGDVGYWIIGTKDGLVANVDDSDLPEDERRANSCFIASTRTSNPLLIKALRRAMSELKHRRTVEHLPTKAETDITAILNGEEKK